MVTSMTVRVAQPDAGSSRAALEGLQQAEPTEEELAQPPPERSFLPSVGVSLENSGRTATLKLDKFQVLVSRDWISPSHEQKTRSWKVQCCGDLSNGFNTFVGVTSASSFCNPGYTIVFDANGNTQYDINPMLLGFVYPRENLSDANLDSSVELKGTFPVRACKEHTFQVNVDIENLTLDIKISTARILVDLGKCFSEWNQIRLAVFVQPGSEDQRRVRLVKPS